MLSSVGIEGINMDEAKEKAEKLSSLWEEDIRFYFKLLLKPWEAFEKPIPTRLSLELAAIATLFSLDISSPFPPRYFAQRFFCWVAYNSVLLLVYSLIFALSGKRDRIHSPPSSFSSDLYLFNPLWSFLCPLHPRYSGNRLPFHLSE